MEDPITRAGLEVKVDRKVYRLVKDDKAVDVAGGHGQAVGQRVERYRREVLADGASLKSGELVEVELEIDSKNDYEYLVFEDYKASGFEPVEVRSGYNGNDLGAYVEFRDERVAFFTRTLARGKHSVSYRLRAEIPGRFHALPARRRRCTPPSCGPIPTRFDWGSKIDRPESRSAPLSNRQVHSGGASPVRRSYSDDRPPPDADGHLVLIRINMRCLFSSTPCRDDRARSWLMSDACSLSPKPHKMDHSPASPFRHRSEASRGSGKGWGQLGDLLQWRSKPRDIGS